MTERRSRKRRNSLTTQAEVMREAKARKRWSASETRVLDHELGEAEGQAPIQDSALLPGPDCEESCPSERDNGESSDDDYACQFSQDDADAAYQDWVQSLGRDDMKMMTLMLHENYKARFGLTNSGAAAEVALLLDCKALEKRFLH